MEVRVRVLLDLVRVRVCRLGLYSKSNLVLFIWNASVGVGILVFDAFRLLSLFYLDGKNRECSSCGQGGFLKRQCRVC